MAQPSFFTAGGTLHPEAPSYVRRPADDELLKVARSGQLAYILTTRQMGKSSLMNQTSRQLAAEGWLTAISDLTALGTAEPDAWYLSLLDDICYQLDLDMDLDGWWEARAQLTPERRLLRFVQEQLVGALHRPVVLFFDELDSVLRLPFADDFFATLRAIHNWSVSRQAEPPLSLVLLGVAAPNDLIRDNSRTPFNVGQRIQLAELPRAETIAMLSAGLPGYAPAAIERIYHWTNGHPYLTQKLGQALSNLPAPAADAAAVDQLVKSLFLTDQAHLQESNLQFVAGRILNSPQRNALLQLYQRVRTGRRPVTADERDSLQTELRLYGLVSVNDKHQLHVRNEIYRHSFDETWLRLHAPRQPNRALLLVGLVLLAACLITIFYRPGPSADDLLAEAYLQEFSDATNPTIRLNALGNLLLLPDHITVGQTAFAALPTSEQVELFRDVPADLDPPIAEIIQHLYQTLYESDIRTAAPGSDVLAAMAAALAVGETEQASPLQVEINSWLRGRSAALNGELDSARIDYAVALRLAPDNPATRLENAQVALALQDLETALAELQFVAGEHPDWEAQTAALLNSSPELQAALRDRIADYPELTAWAGPEAANTPSAVAAAAVTATPVATVAPASTATPSRTPRATAMPLSAQQATELAIAVATVAPSATPPAQFVAPPAGPIIFTCFLDGLDQLCLIDAATGESVQITDFPATSWYASFAPELNEIIFSSSRSGVFSLYLYDLLGNDWRQLTESSSGDYAPAISPDGTKIAFVRSSAGMQNIWLMNRDGSDPQQITFVEGDAVDPVWMPDGEHLVYAEWLQGSEGGYTHVLIRPDGSERQPILTNVPSIGGRSDVSPDGQWLAFYAGPASSRNIYLVNLTTGELRQLTDTASNTAPSFSPDGQWLVFTSGRDG
ncbi:MAG: AAA-like domain-containing protein, partial [Ardenticatenales bacterium]|nr:AAA-like domain-containing protein [Ardenticatenales bacterium]